MASEILEISTKDNKEYTFYPITSGCVRFQVKAAGHICITLTPKPIDLPNKNVKVFFGFSKNNSIWSSINRDEQEVVKVETPTILKDDEFKGFWICWGKGILRAGEEDKTTALLTWEDPEPFPIACVGVRTLSESGAIWKIEGSDRKELHTPHNDPYKFQPVLEGSLEFEFRGPRDCHVVLTPGPSVMENMYEVILGGWGNTKSAIGKVEVQTPKFFNPKKFKKIVIKWKSGLVKVCDETNTVFMEWQDLTSPLFSITHFGVRTTLGATGDWRISTIPSGNKPSSSE